VRYLILVIALLSTLSALDWPDNYKEALAQAKKEKKDIYLFIGSEDCKFCEKLKKEVFSQKEVVDKLKKDYVLIYLSTVIDDIPSQFEINPIPRHYFLTDTGSVIYTTIGGRSKEGFYELLDDVKEIKED